MGIRHGLRLTTLGVASLALAACGGGDPLEDEGSDSSGDGTAVVVTGQNFTEAALLASMYEQVLDAAGYDASQELVDARDIYFSELENGGAQVAPDYLAGIGDFLNETENGADADPITSNSPDETLDAVQPLAEGVGVTLLEPSEATNQNAYAVTQDFSDENSVTTLTQLGELGEPVVLAANPDCEGRQDCEAGLRSLYDIDITEVIPTGFGGAPTTNAVVTGEAQLGQFGTTDGTLEENGLVLLEDDQGLQPAQNLTPAVNTEFLDDNPDVADVLNELSQTLTTDDLATLNLRVDRDREQVADVAADYLSEAGLV